MNLSTNSPSLYLDPITNTRTCKHHKNIAGFSVFLITIINVPMYAAAFYTTFWRKEKQKQYESGA